MAWLLLLPIPGDHTRLIKDIWFYCKPSSIYIRSPKRNLLELTKTDLNNLREEIELVEEEINKALLQQQQIPKNLCTWVEKAKGIERESANALETYQKDNKKAFFQKLSIKGFYTRLDKTKEETDNDVLQLSGKRRSHRLDSDTITDHLKKSPRMDGRMYSKSPEMKSVNYRLRFKRRRAAAKEEASPEPEIQIPAATHERKFKITHETSPSSVNKTAYVTGDECLDLIQFQETVADLRQRAGLARKDQLRAIDDPLPKEKKEEAKVASSTGSETSETDTEVSATSVLHGDQTNHPSEIPQVHEPEIAPVNSEEIVADVKKRAAISPAEQGTAYPSSECKDDAGKKTEVPEISGVASEASSSQTKLRTEEPQVHRSEIAAALAPGSSFRGILEPVDASISITISVTIRSPHFVIRSSCSSKIQSAELPGEWWTLLAPQAEQYSIHFRGRPRNHDWNEREEEISSSSRPIDSSQLTSIPLFRDSNLISRLGPGLKEPPPAEDWHGKSVILLTDNEFSFLKQPQPECPSLELLLLQRNSSLVAVPHSFFESMPSLRFLDMSYTRIRSLPSSLFKLTKLEILILRYCDCLDKLPSEIEQLKLLEVLDLWGTEIYELPDKIIELKSLRHLFLSFYGADDESEYDLLPSDLISRHTLSKLYQLKSLCILVHPEDKRWLKHAQGLASDIGSLEKLSYLHFYFPEATYLRDFIEVSPSWNENRLIKFKFVVGQDVKRIVSRVSDDTESRFDQHDRCFKFVNGDGDGVPPAVETVLRHTTALYLDHHLTICSLSELGISNMNQLKFCIVRECPGIRFILDGDERREINAFPSLEHLSIFYLWNLERIICKDYRSFRALRTLTVGTCPKLEFVLSGSMLPCLRNLEELVVEDCKSLREIIRAGEQQQLVQDCFPKLPKLKKVELRYLPELVSLWSGFYLSNEKITIFSCPKLMLDEQQRSTKRRKLIGVLCDCSSCI